MHTNVLDIIKFSSTLSKMIPANVILEYIDLIGSNVFLEYIDLISSIVCIFRVNRFDWFTGELRLCYL